VEQVWNGRRRLHKLCEAATKLLSTHGKKVSTADAVSVHTCVSDATEVIGTAHSRDAAALTAETIHGLASGLQAAVEAAYGGAKSVPSSGGWADAVKAVTTGSEWMPPGAELCMSALPTDVLPCLVLRRRCCPVGSLRIPPGRVGDEAVRSRHEAL
jgi:hypothetical protein